MKQLSRILAATDLSAPARHAVERAFHLAAIANSELYILHAIELGALDSLREMLGDNVLAVKATLNNDAHARLEQVTGNATINRGVAPHTCVADGNPLATISAEAEGLDVDLVIIGARGESFLRHTLLGSTAARLLRKASRHPVLVVKQPPHEVYRSVLIAVDFSPVSLQAIRMARQVAPGADLVLLHAFELPYEGKLTFAGVDEHVIRQYVRTSSETHRKRLHDLAVAAGLTAPEYTARIVHGDPSQQIIVMEQEVDADLIVVGKHGAHIAEELLIGSVTKHVLAESQCDLLVMCDPHVAPESSP